MMVFSVGVLLTREIKTKKSPSKLARAKGVSGVDFSIRDVGQDDHKNAQGANFVGRTA